MLFVLFRHTIDVCRENLLTGYVGVAIVLVKSGLYFPFC